MPRSGALCPQRFMSFSLVVLSWSQWRTRSLNPCLEVIPGTVYRCMELNLSGIPSDIPNSTESLDLSFNPLKILTSNYFSQVPALRFLDLTRCHIWKIEDNAFMGLCNLSVLILTANPLHILDPWAFQDLTSLQRLIVVESHISRLDRLPIGHLTTLQELNLSNNHIDSLRLPEYFSQLIVLQLLNLQANKISSIFVGDLDALPSQNVTLVLSKNYIKYIELNSFSGVYFQELSLRGCFESSALMQASLQNLTGLHVNHLVLGDYRNIARLETFNKPLLDGLCHVRLQEITLIQISVLYTTDSLSDCLHNIPSVRLVSTDIKEVTPFPKNSSIRQLEFKNCKLRGVPADSLSSLKELRVLRITKNPRYLMRYVEDFQGLQNLETLDLSENTLIVNIYWSSFMEEVPNLKHLNLSFNSKVALPPECSGVSKLEYLDLQQTRLGFTGALPSFLCLGNLIYLDISHSSTHIVTECSFCGLDNLRVLKMAGSSFEGNQLAGNFKNLTKLQILDISSCQLKHIVPSALAQLHDLRELNISHNKLLSLDPKVYVHLHALTILDLHSNQLAALTAQALEDLPTSLKYLDLSWNLFDCSCDHLIFFRWATNHQDILKHADFMVCHSPLDLKDVRLVSFDLSSCHVSKTTVAASVTTLLVLVLFAILVYKYYFHLYYMVVLLSRDHHSTEKEHTYDAFVIYSSEDQEWVTKELEETLEVGVPRFRLCLYYRDFVPGVSIITNIIKEGFQSSRKVIAVVSTHFLESRWCNFELEVAQSWQLLDSKASLVLVVLEGVDKAVVRRKLGVFRYLRRNTYLVWRDRELTRHVFLRQLKSALLDGKTWTEEELKLMLNN
ncbi:toll-like receptor 4 [Sceloporus undulatus]|uniref:toll-like receptor 4 n=1 Tax=Sceloporus undulatus TaxID=8520 RepID=UPI001C4B93C6|nr:toll-like receptor 4 [Sceloporus undulatus]